MDVFDLTGSNERHPIYKELERTNGIRHYNFLQSIISASLEIKYNNTSHEIIKAVNFHAIACLHRKAGEYRDVDVRVNGFTPPCHESVNNLMDGLVKEINDRWRFEDPVFLASHMLWRLNAIHPFVNGNGRTARALCYYILCCKFGTLFGGRTILPELIRKKYRSTYVKKLKEADNAGDATPLAELVEKIIAESIK